jgi:hypothetical protein
MIVKAKAAKIARRGTVRWFNTDLTRWLAIAQAGMVTTPAPTETIGLK